MPFNATATLSPGAHYGEYTSAVGQERAALDRALSLASQAHGVLDSGRSIHGFHTGGE
jgi:hypothetical protein